MICFSYLDLGSHASPKDSRKLMQQLVRAHDRIVLLKSFAAYTQATYTWQRTRASDV
jgi:hypothetical protein